MPLYLELYLESVPALLGNMEKFLEVIIKELEDRGSEVVVSEISMVKSDFEKAVNLFEKEEVDAIVTLHLSYSPSLEVVPALKNTDIPIIALDTTVDYAFDETTSTDNILTNHGIHGVQDMCGVLRREGVKYEVVAGHYKHSDVLDRLIKAVTAASMVNNLRKARVGKVGAGFKGMGDFEIGADSLAEIGIEEVSFDMNAFQQIVDSVTEEELQQEWEKDNERFLVEGLSYETYKTSERISLAIRKWIDEKDLTALTVNFADAKAGTPLHTMPFVEMSKAMSRGIGFAGEGDVFTAAYVGALLQGLPETSFMEMFCPDWKGDSVFLSHMGEWNLDLSRGKGLLMEKDFPYADAPNPAVVNGCFKDGKAVVINVTKNAQGKMDMIVCSGEMITSKDSEGMRDSVRGWFKPQLPLANFLEEYSRLGGGHHGALVYNPDIYVLRMFAYFLGWKIYEI